MDVAALTQMISTLGFPVACVIFLGFFILRIYKRSEEREDKLMAEIAENRVINGKAIETIASYAEKLDVIQKDIGEIKTDVIQIMSKQQQ